MGESVETGKRVVVSGQWDGNVIPANVEEMNREILVQPGARVTGSIFGRSVRIQGPAEIEQGIYATEELEITPSEGITRLNSSIGCRETLAVRRGEGRTVVAGDVNARNVRLEDSAVRGSVHGRDVLLDRCLVFGAVHGEEKLELRDTAALVAYGKAVSFRPGCALILPYARADEDLEIDTTVQLLGFPASNGALTEQDVVTRNGGVHHLTAGRRLTDLAQTRTHLENLRNFISRVSLADVLQSIPDTIAYSEEDLPEQVRAWLDAGELLALNPISSTEPDNRV